MATGESNSYLECLSMLKVLGDGGEHSQRSECAILLGINADGGLIQTTCPFGLGGSFEIQTPDEATEPPSVNGGKRVASSHCVKACVLDCEQDDYGFLVHFKVLDGNQWFPVAYQPDYVHAPELFHQAGC